MVATLIGAVALSEPIVIGLIKAKVYLWWTASFVVAIFFLVICFFLLFRRVAVERDSLKWREGVKFYPCRPAIDVYKKFVAQYSVIDAIYGTGESIEGFKLYEQRFRDLILLDPEGEHINTVKPGFHVNSTAELKDRVERTTRNAQRFTKVHWFDGCSPFSLTLGDPDSPENAGAFLEIYVPYRAGDVRPSLIFKRKDNPELFDVLKQSFAHLLRDSREAPKL